MRKKQKISKVKRIGTCLVACIMIAAMTITSVPLFQTEVRASGVSNPWDGSSREVPETDEDGTYLIHNGAQLAWFADQVNSGNGEINARLEDYIYLNKYNTSHKWVIIGDSQEHPYKGTFDGNGQKIVYTLEQLAGTGAVDNAQQLVDQEGNDDDIQQIDQLEGLEICNDRVQSHWYTLPFTVFRSGQRRGRQCPAPRR